MIIHTIYSLSLDPIDDLWETFLTYHSSEQKIKRALLGADNVNEQLKGMLSEMEIELKEKDFNEFRGLLKEKKLWPKGNLVYSQFV